MNNKMNHPLITVDGRTLMDRPLDPPNFVVDTLISQGLHILAGSPKVGKSWLALWLAVTVAKGEPVWNMTTKQGTTLYLCLEDSVLRIQNRLFEITEDAPDSVHFCTECALIGQGLEEQVDTFVAEHPDTVLVIIDTLQMVRPIHDATYANDYRDKIVIQLFEQMKTAPRSQLIQKQREKELQLANSSVANLEKLHAAAERELESYKKEIIKTINGTGSFGADILGEMIEDTRSKLTALAQELEQAKEKAADLKNSAVAVQKEYDKIMSWADLYAGSSIEGKKMILRQLIERVNIGKNFEIEVEFKISVTQFFDFLYPEGDKSVYYRAS